MKTKNRNKITETTLVQPKQEPQILKYQDWAKKNFNEFDSKKCMQNNQAVLICVNSKCTKQNPFICNAKKCQCMIFHKLCSMRNYESFLQDINSKKSISSKIQNKVEILMDSLVDIISETKESLLKKLSQGQLNNSLMKDKEKLRQKQLQNLVKQKITGSLISKIFEFGSQNFKDEKLQSFSLLLQKTITNFKQNQLEKLKSDLRKLLFSEMNVCWNQNQKFSQMQVRGNKFTHTGNHSQIKISFIEPNIAKFPGNIIKWRIKISNLSEDSIYTYPWIAMGIGFKNILKNNDYIFNKEKNESCYMISNDGLSFAAFDLKKDNMKGFGFQFNSWSIVQIELDKIKWEIKFRKVNSLQQTKLKILLEPQSQADSYNICVGSSSFGNSVEILSVESQFGVYLK